MKTKLLYFFTRTPLHVGSGSALGAVDQPVARERHTGFPIIPGSAVKGVLSDAYLESPEEGHPLRRNERGRTLFGHENPEAENAASGSVAFGEARLLAFPVRSLKGCFAWLTSPLCMRRWAESMGETSLDIPRNTDFPGDTPGAAFDPNTFGLGQDSNQAAFEDYVFTRLPDLEAKREEIAQRLMDAFSAVPLWTDEVATRLVFVNDETLSHYARNCCQIDQHVAIDDLTGTARERHLFNTESVPSETLFVSTLSELRPGSLEDFSVENVLQLGGDATTGSGFCVTQLQVLQVEEGGAV